MRLAGTAKQYSNRAIDQPTRIAVPMVQLGKRNWPYQAKVMKMLETMRRAMVSIAAAYSDSKGTARRKPESMDEEIERLVVSVRADTSAFARDVASMRGELEGPLVAGAGRAGRLIDSALAR